MIEVRFRGLAAGIAFVLLFGACSSDSRPITATDAAAQDASTDQSGDATESSVASAGTGSALSQSRPPKRILPRKANRQGGDTTNGLRPLQLPWKSVVPVSARVEPKCVQRGETVRLVIETKNEAALAFQAIYSDNRGGAEKPFGAGYGGNDKGKTGTDGRVVRSWVVGPTAPFGTGRIDIIVGWNGKWGYLGEPFAVADASGTCDAS